MSTPVASSLLSRFDEEWTRLRPVDAGTNNLRGAVVEVPEEAGLVNSGATALPCKPPSVPEAAPPQLPLYSYKHSSPSPIRLYIRDETEANHQVSQLRGPLGFDLEWRVLFYKGAPEQKTAVLQLSDQHRILVIQISAMKAFPAKAKAIVESPHILKMGVNIINDGYKLRRDYGIFAAGLLELSHLAHLVDESRVATKRMISLKNIVEMYTGHTLDKGKVQTSNWEAKLTEKQLEYAANDAHSALGVYTQLMRMAQDMESTVGSNITPASVLGLTKAISHQYSHAPRPPVERQQNVPSRFGAVPVTSPDQYTASKRPVRGRLLKSYKLWHEENMSLPDICSTLRSPEHPLAKSTVISYVVEALKADTSLEFSKRRLRELAKLDDRSWQRHGWWIESLDKTSRGLDD